MGAANAMQISIAVQLVPWHFQSRTSSDMSLSFLCSTSANLKSVSLLNQYDLLNLHRLCRPWTWTQKGRRSRPWAVGFIRQNSNTCLDCSCKLCCAGIHRLQRYGNLLHRQMCCCYAVLGMGFVLFPLYTLCWILKLWALIRTLYWFHVSLTPCPFPFPYRFGWPLLNVKPLG